MDKFKKNNTKEVTALDFYDTCVCKGNRKVRKKDKRMLHKLARTRIKRETEKEIEGELL